MNNYENMSIPQLIAEYKKIEQELKRRNVLRTGNFTGEIGEHMVADIYNKNQNLPNLGLLDVSFSHYDALDINGNRYSIKTITTKTTGKFTGLEPIDSTKENEKLFDYVVICQCDKNLSIKLILELNWETFLKHKKWHKTENAWNLRVTQELIQDSKIILDNRNK